ncbi:hypothetical protein RRG08_053697 [Elysia crispata]|uniref:Uncharacterized protein n=1 Tax=Elysia crispata TaxID=231223 RepID=A0AAE1DN52_9GAST|nr:hypothetical protein RRG08_053697 [Elysia crispata]
MVLLMLIKTSVGLRYPHRTPSFRKFVFLSLAGQLVENFRSELANTFESVSSECAVLELVLQVIYCAYFPSSSRTPLGSLHNLFPSWLKVTLPVSFINLGLAAWYYSRLYFQCVASNQRSARESAGSLDTPQPATEGCRAASTLSVCVVCRVSVWQQLEISSGECGTVGKPRYTPARH